MAVQTVLAGSAALAIGDYLILSVAGAALGWMLAAASLVHLLFVAGEITLPHVSAHAHLATWEMTNGRYRFWFWSGIALSLFGLAAPWLGPWVALPALAGLFAHEHAYIQSAQAVPLA
jgi:hypothetical protein